MTSEESFSEPLQKCHYIVNPLFIWSSKPHKMEISASPTLIEHIEEH